MQCAHKRLTCHALYAWPNLFAALYDDELEQITDRMMNPGETLIYPLSDTMIRGAVRAGDRGEFDTIYHGENSVGEEIRVFYRWVPSGSGYNHKILFIVSMRERPLDNEPTAMLIRWCVILIVLTGIINLVCGISFASTTKKRVK